MAQPIVPAPEPAAQAAVVVEGGAGDGGVRIVDERGEPGPSAPRDVGTERREDRGAPNGGYVADVEHTRGADMALVRLAENAARNWQFVPARKNDETVSSEVILHFMFRSSKAEP